MHSTAWPSSWKQQEHLLQARKIAALGTFTAGIPHELNNPINNISLTAETYLEEYSELMDHEGKELIRDILSQLQEQVKSSEIFSIFQELSAPRLRTWMRLK